MSNWTSPQTLALLGGAAGFLDPHGGFGAGFQGAMNGLMTGNELQHRKLIAEMQNQKFLREQSARQMLQETLQQHTKNDGSIDHKGAINALMSSGMPELMAHIKTLQSAIPQYKAKIEATDENGRPVVKYIDSFGGVTNTGETPWKAPIKMDQGGSNALIDPVSMKPVAQYGKTISPGESARLAQSERHFGANYDLNRARFAMDYSPEFQAQKAGEIAGAKESAVNRIKAQADLPKVIQQGEESIKLIDDLLAHPGFKISVGKSAVVGSPLSYVPGTDAASFDIALKQLKGKQFLEAFEMLKGGGQITEIEGTKATQAISRMEKANTEDEFIKASREFQQIIRNGIGRAKTKAGQPPASQNKRSTISGGGWAAQRID